MRSNQQVIVVDADSRFLEYVNPVVARKLIEAGLATKYSYDPFILKLNKDASTRFARFRSISALIKWH